MRARTIPLQHSVIHPSLVLEVLAKAGNQSKMMARVHLLRLRRPFLQRQRIAGPDVILAHILEGCRRFGFGPHDQPRIIFRKTAITEIDPDAWCSRYRWCIWLSDLMGHADVAGGC